MAMDSGASQHYCNDLVSFMDYAKFSKPQKTIIGDGRIVLGYGSGTVWWKAPDNSETPIYNIIFTLEMKENLLSIKKLDFWIRRHSVLLHCILNRLLDCSPTVCHFFDFENSADFLCDFLCFCHVFEIS